MSERRGEELTGLNMLLRPGTLVRHPGAPDWGLGQVQSVAGWRITVNFEHAGKVVIDGTRIALEAVSGTGRGQV